MSAFELREGEEVLPFDPGSAAFEAGLVFIGRIRSPWTTREACPKNMAVAEALGGGGRVEVDAAYRPGLEGLGAFSHAIVLSWLDRGPRTLIRQKPRHAASPSGVFSLRSPLRPNPIGVHVARIVALDLAAGVLQLAGIDALDGTPVVDLKPYHASTDAAPEAKRR
jgi:tRNA-Thr(GGU) m(6)t(6)A37 methyltransferase TsaA